MRRKILIKWSPNIKVVVSRKSTWFYKLVLEIKDAFSQRKGKRINQDLCQPVYFTATRGAIFIDYNMNSIPWSGDCDGTGGNDNWFGIRKMCRNYLILGFHSRKNVHSSCCRRKKARQVGWLIKKLVRPEYKEGERRMCKNKSEEIGRGTRILMAL